MDICKFLCTPPIKLLPPIKTRSFYIVYNNPRHGITLKVATVTHDTKFFSEGLKDSVSFTVNYHRNAQASILPNQ